VTLATAIILTFLALLVIFCIWKISRIEPPKEVREELESLDIASGKYMRFRRIKDIEQPSGKTRVGL